MKRLSLTILLLGVLGAHAFGQATWFPGVAQTTTTVSATNTTVLVPLPRASITFCGYPSNGSLPCTNKAPVCPDITGAGCTTGAPNNPVTADSLGNFGAWLPSGSYDYTVCAVSGVCQGPYHAVVVSSNGAQGVFTVDGAAYTTIQSAITAAGTTGSVLIPPTYAGTDVYTNTNKIQITDLRGKPNRQRGFVNVLVDCGAKGDGVTNDGPAIQACFDAFPGYGFIFPQTITHGCSYFSSQTLNPKGTGYQLIGGSSSNYLDGAVAAGNLGGVEICFGAGVTGILHDANNASAGTIRNLSLKGAAGITSLQTPTALNIPSSLPQFTRSITSIQRATNVLTITIATAGGVEALTQQVGSTVKISGVVGDTTMNGKCIVATLVAGGGTSTNPRTLTCAQNGSDAGPFASDGTLSLPTTGAGNADGIRVCGNFLTLDHVGVVEFERHGINADSVSGNGCTLPFSDDIVMRDSIVIENSGDGFYCKGTDCNAGYLSGNVAYYNLLYGVEDQSSLGNTWAGNQISNNGHLWATSTTPATKAIGTIARTLTSGISQVSVVLSVADTNIKLGSCVVIAGVTDTSFNTTSGQCFFVNSFTDSTHYGYEQPGAPANASSSAGTSRMAKFSEAYLSAGVDDGAVKFGTQTGVWASAIFSNYVEGGQNCKYGATVINFGGADQPGCVPSDDWKGLFITANGVTGGAGTNITNFTNAVDNNLTVQFKSGRTSDFNITTQWKDHNGTTGWSNIITPASGGSFQFFDRSSVRRYYIDATAFRINSTSTSAVEINKDSGATLGTGGLEVWSGGASPQYYAKFNSSGITVGDGSGSTVATVTNAGLGTFNGGVKAGSSGSTISDSRELVQNAHECGTTTACANTANLSERMITGTVPLSSATPSTATITGISPAFTSTATYFCTATPEGATAAIAAGGIAISKVSGSSFTLTGPATVTTVIDYICIGH